MGVEDVNYFNEKKRAKIAKINHTFSNIDQFLKSLAEARGISAEELKTELEIQMKLNTLGFKTYEEYYKSLFQND